MLFTIKLCKNVCIKSSFIKIAFELEKILAFMINKSVNLHAFNKLRHFEQNSTKVRFLEYTAFLFVNCIFAVLVTTYICITLNNEKYFVKRET